MSFSSLAPTSSGLGVDSTGATLARIVHRPSAAEIVAQRAARWQWLADIALVLNLSLYLVAGALPIGPILGVLRYSMTAASLALVYVVAFQIDARVLKASCAIFLPFGLVGLVAALFGTDMVYSLNFLTRWGVLILFATALSSAFDQRRTVRIIFYALLASMVVSIAVAVAVPAFGTETYGGEVVWRGIFLQKNYLGWTALISAMVALALAREHWSLRLALFLCAVVALWGSGAKGSLIIIVAALGYWLFLIAVARLRLPPATVLSIQATAMVVAALSFLTIAQVILPLLGRDLTFTGRTDIWAVYLTEALKHPILGQGPGALTSENDLTMRLVDTYDIGGGLQIHTPHNAFIGVFGDAGILGLATFVGLLAWLALIAPAFSPTLAVSTCALFAFVRVAVGFTETFEVYSEGIGLLMIVLTHGFATRARMRPDRRSG